MEEIFLKRKYAFIAYLNSVHISDSLKNAFLHCLAAHIVKDNKRDKNNKYNNSTCFPTSIFPSINV